MVGDVTWSEMSRGRRCHVVGDVTWSEMSRGRRFHVVGDVTWSEMSRGCSKVRKDESVYRMVVLIFRVMLGLY